MARKDYMINKYEYTEDIYNQIQNILFNIPSGYFVSFNKSSLKEDMVYKRDLKILKIQSSTLGMGLRIRDYEDKWKKRLEWRDLSIRYENNKYETEIDGLREGLLKWYLYMWLNSNIKIYEWVFLDILQMVSDGVFEEEFINKHGVFEIKKNKKHGYYDGTSGLYIPIWWLNKKGYIKEYKVVDFLKKEINTIQKTLI